jgi:Pyruvate/2-oxoglutarate dehydrogenase complex, dihydrolipoamide acyltransferase (E2) component, and related enzymes
MWKVVAFHQQITLSSINGSGKGGRVLKEDVLEYLKKMSVPDTTAASGAKSMTTSDYTESIQGFRKAMVKSMTYSWVRSLPVCVMLLCIIVRE